MMGSFGKFLEVALPCGDVLRSLSFYRDLGFSELPTGDIRSWHYAVVTDGHITLGLHGAGIEEPALVFVRPNLTRQVQALSDAGHVFETQRLGSEEFNEAALRAPGGQLILMIEARTFSPGVTPTGGKPLLGGCREVSLVCTDALADQEFFQTAGFLLDEEGVDDVIRLATPGIRLGLRPAAAAQNVLLRFRPEDAGRTLLSVEEFAPRRGYGGHVLRAPEGTLLVIE